MAATSGGERCKFCNAPAVWEFGGYRRDEHSEGCPAYIVDENVTRVDEKLLPEWKAGYRHGFNWDDEEYGYIETWKYCRYSKSYILGYRAGEAEIDRLVELAFQRCYGLELDDD